MGQVSNSTGTIYGTDLVLMIDTGTDQWQQIAHATSHSLSLSRETRDVSSKSTGEWMLSDYAKISWSGSADGLVSFDSGIQGYNELMALQISRSKIKIVSVLADASQAGTVDPFLDDADAAYDPASTTAVNNVFVEGTTYLQGEAVITSMELTAAEGDTATFSMSFSGASPLEQKTVATVV